LTIRLARRNKRAGGETKPATERLMRMMPLLLCLSLAACADAGHALTPEQANAQAQATAPAEPAAPKAKTPARKPARSTKSDKPEGKGNQALGESWVQAQEGVITREMISGGCWMKYERGRRDLPLEQRADLVNRCVDDTLLAYPELSH
jgi:hypothetical protein